MDPSTFTGLRRTDDPLRWELPVELGMCGGGGRLFGGCGLGAAIAALEGSTGRPLAWATCQFTAHAVPGEVLDLQVDVGATGGTITQARLVGRAPDREVLAVTAALGRAVEHSEDDDRLAGAWVSPPEVPPPDDCPRRRTPHHQPGTFSSKVEQRVAAGEWGRVRKAPGGRSALWVRVEPGLATGAAALGTLGDFVPSGAAGALEASMVGGRSLDNTLRVVGQGEVTPWVLCDVRIDAVAHGLAHGSVYQWSQHGDLLAVASQTARVMTRA